MSKSNQTYEIKVSDPDVELSDGILLAYAAGLASLEHLGVASDVVLKAHAERFIKGLQIFQDALVTAVSAPKDGESDDK